MGFDMKSIKCPSCGESYFMEGISTTTAVYYPPIWKDGVNVNPDRNTTTTQYKCLNCGNVFYISHNGNEEEEIHPL